jgi:hypothetical protein
MTNSQRRWGVVGRAESYHTHTLILAQASTPLVGKISGAFSLPRILTYYRSKWVLQQGNSAGQRLHEICHSF